MPQAAGQIASRRYRIESVAVAATHRCPCCGGQFGHWEGDLLIFKRELGDNNITSLVERKSRYTVMIKNCSRHSRPIMDRIIDTFSPLPAFARRSFTFDRGTEFAGFRALEDGISARS